MVGEFGRGELVGIVETLMKKPRSETVIAVRDTEVAKLPSGKLNSIFVMRKLKNIFSCRKLPVMSVLGIIFIQVFSFFSGLIDLIKMRFPNILMRLIKLLGEKLQQSWENVPMDNKTSNVSSQMHCSPQSNLSTVAVIGLSGDIPVMPFTYELLHSLKHVGPCLRLTREYVLSSLGEDAFEKALDFRLSAWLASLEDKYKIILYQCENELNSWTRLCVRHADVIFILANPEVVRLESNMWQSH